MNASGAVIVIAGVWVICQVLVAKPSVLDVLGVK